MNILIDPETMELDDIYDYIERNSITVNGIAGLKTTWEDINSKCKNKVVIVKDCTDYVILFAYYDSYYSYYVDKLEELHSKNIDAKDYYIGELDENNLPICEENPIVDYVSILDYTNCPVMKWKDAERLYKDKNILISVVDRLDKFSESLVAVLIVYDDKPSEDESSRILHLRKQGYPFVIKYTGELMYCKYSI